MTPKKKEITLSCSVDTYRSGWTIIRFLSHRFPYHTPEAWERRVTDGQVLLNGNRADPDTVVERDNTIQYTILHAEPEVDFRHRLIHEDEHLLAVSKSGNIPVHACGVYITQTLIAYLRSRYGETLSLAHRLDRETSGLVILSKHRESARRLSELFKAGAVEKRYSAVVYGRVAKSSFEVNAPVGTVDVRPDSKRYDEGYAVNPRASYLPKRRIDPVNGKPATTRFTRVRHGGAWTVLEAQPLTGRTNQIRVHLAHAGHPLLGDKIYALTGKIREEQLEKGLTDRVREALVLDRHALHCHRLSFTHPFTGVPLALTAPPPEDISRFL